MNMGDDAAFARDYASFLCAAHRSFPAHSGLLRTLARYPYDLLAVKRWRHVLKAAVGKADPNGLVLEFGVFKGGTINYLAKLCPKSMIHGFDSFAGLPSDGRTDWDVDFSVPGLPLVPANVTLHPGYFETTVPPYFTALAREPRPISLVHIDCDIFTSTMTVLWHMRRFIKPGDIFVFDELMNYDGFESHEFLALYMILAELGLDFEWLATWGKAYPYAERGGEMIKGGFDVYRRHGFCQNQAIRIRERGEVGHFGQQDAPPAVARRIAAQLAANGCLGFFADLAGKDIAPGAAPPFTQ